MTNLILTNKKFISEWHPTKNGNLKPSDVSFSSGKKVWWKCKKGHEWEATIASRYNGRNCPYCSNQKVLVGYNDLNTTNPELAKEWHPSKNLTLKPTDVTKGSGKKVWWKCEKGHEWEARICNRDRGSGCPYCSNQKVLVGYNDLNTTNPELAKEWHPSYNGKIKATDVLAKSNKKVWWKCKKGHEWEAVISSRSNGNGCPYCSGKKVLIGYNDLETINPELAKEWHPTQNGDLKPTDVTYSSGRKVWWMCEKGHSWYASIDHRYHGTKCPYCTNRKVWPGYNDLATVNPKLAEEWHPTQNGDLKPTDVTYSSGRKVWWMCEKGHSWRATIDHRHNGTKCPYCIGRYPTKGENDLETLYPEIAKEWHPTKNRNLEPSSFLPNSHRKVWWLCPDCGNNYYSSVGSRIEGRKCPECKTSR